MYVIFVQERDALKSQLASEQDRLKEVNKELVKVRSNLKIGHDAFEAEQKLRLELEEKLTVWFGFCLATTIFINSYFFFFFGRQ